MRKPDMIEHSLLIAKRNTARHYIRRVGLALNECPEFLEAYADEQIDAWDHDLTALVDCFVALYSKYSKTGADDLPPNLGSPLLQEMQPTGSRLLPMGIRRKNLTADE